MKNLIILLALSLMISGCKSSNAQYEYPKSREEQEMERIGSLFNNSQEEGIILFNSSKNNETSKSSSMTVNEIAWKASLETVKFMPLLSSDAVGGVIITDWYQEPKNPSERYKLTIIVSGSQLTASSVKVNVHRQIRKNNDWSNIESSSNLAREIENKIFLNAKKIKSQKRI